MSRPDLEAILSRWKKYGEEHDDIPALLAYVGELTRERDGLKHREDLLKIANEQLLHVNKSVARHGIITESVRRLTDLLSIESTNPTANETTDAAAEAIERLTRERDAANATHETLSALVDGYRRERDNLRAEITKAQESFDDDGPIGWMPGETAIDALIRTRDEAQARCETLRELADMAAGEQGLAQRRMMEAQAQRHAARTEAKALREALETAGERLKACAHELTEFSYQEMASVLFDLRIPEDKP